MTDTNDEYLYEEGDPSEVYDKIISQNTPLSSGETVTPNLTPNNAAFSDLIPAEETVAVRQIISLEFNGKTTSIEELFPEAFKERVVEDTEYDTDENSKKEFLVTLKKDVEQQLSFQDDMEETQEYPTCYDLETGSIVCTQTPLRPVTGTKISDRLYIYYITDDEAEVLKADFRVQAVEVPPDQNGAMMMTDAVQSGNFSRAINGGNTPYDSVTIVLCTNPTVCGSNMWNNINFIPGEEVIQVLNSNSTNIPYNSATAKGTILRWSDGGGSRWPLVTLINVQGEFVETTNYKQQNEIPQYIKGVTSGAVFKLTPYSVGKFLQQDSNWGLLRTNAIGNSEDPIPSEYNYVLDGSGVDVVIIDTGIYVNHPEFEDADGNSRIIQHNWYEAAGRPEDASNQHPRFYTDQSGHGTHVAGTVAGKTFGWAKNAKIYSMKIMGAYSIPWQEAFNLIAQWHLNKPIETETGVRRPTIVNCSWSWSRTLKFGPPMIFGNRYLDTDTTNPVSVWNSETTATSLIELNIKGTVYNKDNVPPSGNTSDAERHDPFNTGERNSSVPTIRDTVDAVNKTWYSFRHLLYCFLYESELDSQGRKIRCEVPIVNINIDYVDAGIQTMIDAGIHVCVAAGNDTSWIVNSSDENFNNTATFKTYQNTSSFGSIVNGSWVLGSSSNYSQSFTDVIYTRKKKSPYAVDAIVVGSINSRIIGSDLEGLSPWGNNAQWQNDVVTNTPGGRETRSSFSNYGTGVDIYAPGQDIISCVPNYYGNNNGIFSPRSTPDLSEWSYTDYKTTPYYYNNEYSQTKLSGTSMASPQVCGVGALLLQLYPDLTPYQLKYLIKEISNKETSLFEFLGTFGSMDRWKRRYYFVGTKNDSSFESFWINNPESVLFEQENIMGIFYYGLGETQNVNVLYNPYSVELPTNFQVNIPQRLVENNSVNMINVVNTTTGLNIIWAELVADDLVGYIVERSISPTAPFVSLFQQPITSRSYLDLSVPYDTTYYYRVRAIGANSTQSQTGNVLSGTRIRINDVIVQNRKVTGVSATATFEGIRLNWNAVDAQDHSHYEIQRSTSLTGSYTKINSSNITTTSYIDADVSSLVRYYYKVYSINYNGVYSPASDVVFATALSVVTPIQISSTGELPELGWQLKGNVIKTTDAGYSTGEEGLRMFNSSWAETAISTVGYENIKLEFGFKTNNFKSNEFFAILYNDGIEWKTAFIGTSETYQNKEISLKSNSYDKTNIVIRFHSFVSYEEDNKYVDIDQISIYGQQIS